MSEGVPGERLVAHLVAYWSDPTKSKAALKRGRFNPADEQLYVCGLCARAGNHQHPAGFFRVRRTEWTKRSGSDHLDERELPVTAAMLSSAGRRVPVAVPDFGPTWWYSIEWDVETAAGVPVKGRLHGTMH